MPPRVATVRGNKLVGTTRRNQNAAEKARKRQAEREKQKRKLQREAQKIELEPHPQDYLEVLRVTHNMPRKRYANAALDDKGRIKRPKHTPWEHNKKLEQPPSPFDLGRGFDNLRLDPVIAMGKFGDLAAEIREEILRYLLLCPHDIRVFRGWSRVYPRSKPKLDLTILSTCKLLRKQGLSILFGENTFVYDIRDPAAHLAATNPVLTGVFGGSMIPINQYGHLIRHIGIEVPANRLDTPNIDKFNNAIIKFLPGNGLLKPASIHTLTLNLPVSREQGQEGSGWPPDPSTIPILKFIAQGSKFRLILLHLNVQFVRILATNKDAEIYEHMIPLRYLYKQRQEQQARGRVEYPVKDAMGATLHFQRQVRLAKARIQNLPIRLYELAALGIFGANNGREYWKFIGKQETARYLAPADEQSLPSDYESLATPIPSPPPQFKGEQHFEVDPAGEVLEDLVSEDEIEVDYAEDEDEDEDEDIRRALEAELASN